MTCSLPSSYQQNALNDNRPFPISTTQCTIILISLFINARVSDYLRPFSGRLLTWPVWVSTSVEGSHEYLAACKSVGRQTRCDNPTAAIFKPDTDRAIVLTDDKTRSDTIRLYGIRVFNLQRVVDSKTKSCLAQNRW